MKRLIKYLIIIYSILVILILLLHLTTNIVIEEAKEKYDLSTKINEDGTLVFQNPERAVIHKEPINYIKTIIDYTLFFGFPIFLIIIGAIYLYKEKEGYLKSIAISMHLPLLALVLSFVWIIAFNPGEGGAIIFYLWPMSIGTIIVSAVVNTIVLKIVKKQDAFQ